jgi:cbb3-type cytochrome oxidase subunit 3
MIYSKEFYSTFWLSVVAGITLILIGVWVVVLRLRQRKAAAYASLAKTLPDALATAQKADFPLVPADLRPTVPIPDAENAAPLYLRLVEISKERSTEEAEAENQLLRVFLQSSERPEALRQEMKIVLRRADSFLSLAEQAAELPSCDFARPWEKGSDVELVSEYRAMRNAARLLAARAIVHKDDNQPERALQDIRTAVRIGRHASSDPVVLSLLIDCAIKMIAHRAFVEVLKQQGDRPGLLQQASQIHQEFEPVPQLRQAFAGEIIIGRASMEERRHSPEAIMALAQTYGIKATPKNDRQKQEMIDAWESRLIDYWRRVDEALITASDDLKLQGDLLAQIQAEMQELRDQPGYEINAAFTPIFTNVSVKVMQCRAHNHLQSRLIALLRYRNSHGVFPDSLSVVPSPEDNNDPFTNQPLLYRKTSTGFLIYSVGKDRKDDGGSVKQDEDKWTEDIVLSYP